MSAQTDETWEYEQPEYRPDGMVPLSGDMPYRAYKLRMRGLSWSIVAEHVGYANAATARVAVRQYLTSAAVAMERERKEEVIGLEMDRLDELMNAYYNQAVSGDDIKAADFCLRVIKLRKELMEVSEGQSTGHTTVVIAGSSEEYIESIKQAKAIGAGPGV